MQETTKEFTRETATRNARVLVQRAESILHQREGGINPYTIETLLIFGDYVTTSNKKIESLEVYVELRPTDEIHGKGTFEGEYEANRKSVELYKLKHPDKKFDYNTSVAGRYAKNLILNTLKGKSRVIRLHGTSERRRIYTEILNGRVIWVVKDGELVSPESYGGRIESGQYTSRY